MPETSDAVHFTDEVLANISAALPPAASPERVALLPALLQAWAREDLHQHLTREGRAVVKERTVRLKAVGEKASSLLGALQEADEQGLFQIACGAQMRREARIGNSRWGRTGRLLRAG